jgi:hypothetical protein
LSPSDREDGEAREVEGQNLSSSNPEEGSRVNGNSIASNSDSNGILLDSKETKQ